MSDAAWEATRFRAGLAWVIKGELTSEVRRGSSVHDFVNSPLVGEALAIREGLFMAANQGISNLWCCSDNLTLIRAITHKIQRKELQGIIKDIHNLSSAFVSLDFFHVSRENNEEADALANVVLRNSHM
uniref:RNase H type-1 domain-containing protein n=1 Tax=Brassica oleracea var. oleracea TaxID=109376 RepID=A0A0D3D5T8_BRAOL